jgi:hypothetical protein
MINIIAIDESHLDKCCIYRIWFGCKFYIGATINSYERILTHIRTISAGFEGKREGKNSITNIVNHLKSNPFIETAFFELLEECKTEIDLVDGEHEWLYIEKGNPLCLNQNFNVHRTINGVIVRPNGNFAIKQNNKYVLVSNI